MYVANDCFYKQTLIIPALSKLFLNDLESGRRKEHGKLVAARTHRLRLRSSADKVLHLVRVVPQALWGCHRETSGYPDAAVSARPRPRCAHENKTA